jgi:protein-L-isoaspartate(D-aspartate) O-methyltransferase
MGLFSGDGGDPADRRAEMVERLAERGRISDAAALDALRSVPRHEFVPENQQSDAYADRPLPIGEGQTISAPHMVGIMLELLELEPGQTVLEIGTGCGYHAAATAEVVGAEGVYSVEYHDRLAEQARARFAALGYGDISVRAGDGHAGWPEHAPYDRAYLTCAAPDFPEAVVEQVRAGGVLLAPLGRGHQTLVKAVKREDGALDREDHGGVRFVEMLGEG